MNKQQKKDKAKLTKQQQKIKQHQSDQIQKHLINIDNKSTSMPATEVIHDKDYSGIRDFACENLTLIVAGKTLLEDTTIKLSEGRKYGLVGRNGIGKTCLLTAFAKKEFENMTKNLQILLVEQEIQATDITVLQTVLNTDSQRIRLMEEEEKLQDDESDDATHRLQQIHERLEEIDAHTAKQRASVILCGLGFSHEAQQQKTKQLSGGWRMRVSLARALFVQPDILLLDEPTNHLDLDAVIWLENYLQTTDSTVIIVSHAREFLNQVCTDIIHFFDKTVTYYKGDYDTYEKARNDTLIMVKKQRECQQAKIEHVQQFIDKFRANNKRATLVQSRIKSLAKMDVIQAVLEDPTCIFQFPEPELLHPPLLKIEEGSFGYTDNNLLFRDIEFGVDMDSRIALIGANGAGKSTLLKILIGDLHLNSGQQYRSNRMRLSYFAQHHIDQLDLTLTPIEQLQRIFPGEKEEIYRSKLSKFGIIDTLQVQRQYLMSGGQKSRVAFCINVWKEPHVLIMDEPTNHLDIDAVNALICAISNFNGGVLIVSHDQHLVSNVCDQIYYIKDQKLKKFNSDFTDYRKALLKGKL